MGRARSKCELSVEEEKPCNSNGISVTKRSSAKNESEEETLPEQARAGTGVCNSAVDSLKCAQRRENNSCTLKPTNPIDLLCIPCKRSKKQKEKEAWFMTQSEPTTNEAQNESKVEASAEASVDETNESKTSDNVWSAANKVLLSRLECPVCLQFLTPPLRQCRNGHSICSSCHNRLNRCPTCRRSFIETSNVILNELCLIIVVPCQNYSAGCPELLRLSEKAEHEKKCEWMQYNCPQRSKDCSWRGTQHDVLQHVLKEHAGAVSPVQLGRHSVLRYTYGLVRPIEEAPSETDDGNIISRILVLVDADGEEQGVFVFSVKYDVTNESLCGAMRYVGSKQEAVNYSYKIRLTSPDGTFKMSATTLPISYSEDLQDIVAAGAIMRLDGFTFKRFVNEKGKFFVSVKITLRDLDVEQPEE